MRQQCPQAIGVTRPRLTAGMGVVSGACPQRDRLTVKAIIVEVALRSHAPSANCNSKPVAAANSSAWSAASAQVRRIMVCPIGAPTIVGAAGAVALVMPTTTPDHLLLTVPLTARTM